MFQTKDTIIILAIESSCDDTAAAVIINGKLRSNIISSQLIHQKYGGVVPELASRAHQQMIVPVVQKSLVTAAVDITQLTAVAYTQGPGLMGSLLVGSSYARALSLSLGIPSIGINHLKAHVLTHFIEDPYPEWPFLCLLVSGGHTQIIQVNSPSKMLILGKTLDDAAGEAFDKSAKMLGLPYPGGPLIEKCAVGGNPNKFIFPETKVPYFDYSFSGFKTAVLYFIRDQSKNNPDFIAQNMADICASIQAYIVRYLLKNLEKAAIKKGIKEIAIAGGVAANCSLRHELKHLSKRHGWNVYLPKLAYSTDNAAMIAIAAHFKYLEGSFSGLDEVSFARESVAS
jgi:N6-L-threonylcarbamoyladenine synthase